jgi:hypothetical protein
MRILIHRILFTQLETGCQQLHVMCLSNDQMHKGQCDLGESYTGHLLSLSAERYRQLGF